MITDVNPFVYSRPISPEEIVDRDDETQHLLKHAVGGHYVRLYAPRKYGKTSLLRRALADGEKQEGLVPVLVDLYGAVSLADVAVRFERAYAKELRGAIRGRVEEFLQKTGLGLSLGAFGISARLQLEPKTDPLPALHALLDLPLRLEESGGFRAFIALDEFQDIGKVPSLDGILRSHIQFQGDVASYVFAGSEPGLMKQLFETKEAPLYGAAVPVRLGRLRDEDIAEYVAARFRQSKRNVGEALNPLLASAEGHPQRAMLLAHRLWEEVERGARRPWTTGSARTVRPSTSSSPSSRRNGAASTRRNRKRCARSSPARALPTGRPCWSGWLSRRRWRRRRCSAWPRGPRSRQTPASRSSSIRSSQSGSSASAASPARETDWSVNRSPTALGCVPVPEAAVAVAARQRILDSAYELFSRRGVRGVGIDEVIRNASVAKATLYRHFTSKDELVLAFLQQREELWTRAGSKPRRGAAARPEEQLLAIFDLFHEWFQKDDFEAAPSSTSCSR